MEELFLKLFNMSISAMWLIIAILPLRLLLKKAPKAVHVCLWALVGIRLVFPISLESALSLIPSAETVPPEIMYESAPKIESGIGVLNSAVNPVISETLAPQLGDSVNPMQIITLVAAVIWLCGVAAMLIYALIAYLRLLRAVRVSICARDNIWLCDNVSTPFILGFIRPRIYLPSAISEQNAEHVIAHERAHLRRLDHLWKPLGFLLLSVYWFNPAIWLAYVLLCRDIELACDQRVIRKMEAEEKKGYSEALLAFGSKERLITACPLAFGETGVKNRIKSVFNYKKPTLWIIIVTVILIIATIALFLTNPPSSESSYENKLLKIRTTHISGFEASEPYNKFYPIRLGSGAVLPCETTGICDVSFTISEVRPDSLVILLSDPLDLQKEGGGYESVTEFLLMEGDSVRLSTPTDGGGENYVITIVDAMEGITKVDTSLFLPMKFAYVGKDGRISYINITKLKETVPGVSVRILDVRTEMGNLILDVAQRNDLGQIIDDTEFTLWKTKTTQISYDLFNKTKVNLVTMRNITVLPPDGSDVVTSYNLTEKYDISEPGEYGITAPCFELSFNVISTPFDDTIMECDSASFDIDGDGEDEICTVGLTNYGLFSFTFAVREVGQVENRHFTVFYTDPMSDLRFVKNAESGKTQLHAVLGSDGTTLLFDLAVENGRISITSDGKPIEELN